MSSLHIQPWCATTLTEDGSYDKWGYCGPDCPTEENAWKTDDTLRVTHSLNQKEMTSAIKLLGVLLSSLLLIGVMVTGTGISKRIFDKFARQCKTMRTLNSYWLVCNINGQI